MRSTPSNCFVLVLSSVALAACGGGDSKPPDAPAALMGLGQLCVPAMQGADCPTTANGCLTYGAGATMGVCTKVCVQSATFMTNAATPPAPGPLMPDPTAQDGMCTAIYTGAIGTAACDTPVNLMPADNPLKPSTTYTVLMVCSVSCGMGNTCPTGLTCNTADLSCRP